MNVRFGRQAHQPPIQSGPRPIHDLPAHGKLVALIGFVLIVVATPAGLWWAFGGYAILVALVVVLGRVPPVRLGQACLVEAPFLLFALLLPFVARGPRFQVGGLEVSEPGLLGAVTLVIKATLGVVASVTLSATTPARDILVGLERLRLPEQLVAIASFTLRYGYLLRDHLRAMRWARLARGASGRAGGHLAAVAGGVGSLFVRSYERGERVHLAMLARGYSGRMPPLNERSGSGRLGPLVRCSLLPAAAAAIWATAVLTAA